MRKREPGTVGEFKCRWNYKLRGAKVVLLELCGVLWFVCSGGSCFFVTLESIILFTPSRAFLSAFLKLYQEDQLQSSNE
jgi:hypothetical protein